MRNDDVLLLDMLLAIRRIVKFTDGMSEAEFKNDEKTQSAVLREITVLGEAARLISSETESSHAEIPWRQIAGMRNRLIHEYFNVRLDAVWEVIVSDIPALMKRLEAIAPPPEPPTS
jgi:uncharacterized protein with HEPN domain